MRHVHTAAEYSYIHLQFGYLREWTSIISVRNFSVLKAQSHLPLLGEI